MHSCKTTIWSNRTHFHHSRKFPLRHLFLLKIFQWVFPAVRRKIRPLCVGSFLGCSAPPNFLWEARYRYVSPENLNVLAYHTDETLEAKLDPEFNSNADTNTNTNPGPRGILRCLQRSEDAWSVVFLHLLKSSALQALKSSEHICTALFKACDCGVWSSFRNKEKGIKIHPESSNSQILRAGRTFGNYLI